MTKHDMVIGAKFGKWEVISEPFYLEGYRGDKPNWKVRHQHCKCKCECGTIRDVRCTKLRNKNSTSCGCVSKKAHSNFVRGLLRNEYIKQRRK